MYEAEVAANRHRIVQELLERAVPVVIRSTGDRADAVLAEADVGDYHCSLFMFLRSPGETHRLPLCSLTRRELEIVALIAQGRPNKAIARALNISTWTVTSHCRRVFAKLGVRTRAQMIAALVQGEYEAVPNVSTASEPTAVPFLFGASVATHRH